MTKKIRVLELSGSPFEMGYQHGATYKEAIVAFAQERVHLSGDPKWAGQELSKEEVLSLAEACVNEHERYAPHLVEELHGVGEATGLSLAELVIVGGFTDFIDVVHNAQARREPSLAYAGADNCTAFLVPNNKAVEARGFYGQTWDMHDSATPNIIMLRGTPQDKPNFLVFTTVGCVGMIGMNSAGVAVGINNLGGADGQVGVTWPFVVRKMLEQTSAEDALACITSAKLAGAHNYLIMDKAGEGYSVEAMPSETHVTKLGDAPLVHTNHCLYDETRAVQRERPPASQTSSEARLAQGYHLLEKEDVDETDLQALTRDPKAVCVTSVPPLHIETCGAAIMRPASGDFWAVWGLPSENAYEHFNV